jgi:DeoR family glycerol-3-phosphate regulon repressor
MLHDFDEAEYSREAARRAENRVIVADSHKFGRSAPIIVDDPSTYDMLVTDERPPADIEDMLIRNQIELIVASRDG